MSSDSLSDWAEQQSKSRAVQSSGSKLGMLSLAVSKDWLFFVDFFFVKEGLFSAVALAGDCFSPPPLIAAVKAFR